MPPCNGYPKGTLIQNASKTKDGLANGSRHRQHNVALPLNLHSKRSHPKSQAYHLTSDDILLSLSWQILTLKTPQAFQIFLAAEMEAALAELFAAAYEAAFGHNGQGAIICRAYEL